MLDFNSQESENRWQAKLANSPYLTDLVSISEKLEEESRIRSIIEERKKILVADRKRMARNAIFQRYA